ncbi:MAG: NADH:flavin oxidoreductase/NADH oxidase [Chloroflexi bacterium]|nr:NADH:flavin oxidoreductase/NADH oxidase [Chloroflexota bacterium]
MAHLFDPLTIGSITLRNRIGVSPMCQYSYEDGLSNDWQLVHLGSRAAGGVGLVITEATAVEPNGRITPFDVGLWSEEQIGPLKRVTDFIKSQGAVAGIQIAHAGRKACTGRPWEGGKPVLTTDQKYWQVVGPSPIAFSSEHQTPHELKKEEIQKIQKKFADAATRALRAGFEWLELHAAHGYLIHSFYSPLSNHRTDEYGGSFDNRTRFLMETLDGIRKVWPEDLPLTVRISGTDWVEGGWTVQDSVQLSQMMKEMGVDLIDCSSGGNIATVNLSLGAGYQVPISETIRKGAGIATATVGLISSPAHADEIIRNNRADIVLLGRELLRDAYWALHAAKTLGITGPVPVQYLRGF